MLSQYGDHSCEIVVKFDFKSQSYGPETILLKGHAVTLTFITKLWTRLDFAARPCCDLELPGRDPNVAHDTLSNYGDHFCEIVSKSDFKKQSYWPDKILTARSCCDLDLQGNDLNLVRDTLTQHGGHFCETVSKSNFK